MKNGLIVLITVLFICQSLYGGCTEILDTIEVEEGEGGRNGEGDGDGGIPKELIKHQVHTIFQAGIGGGYFGNPGYDRFTFTLFLAHLWEVWNYGAIRAAGEVLTVFGDALTADVTAGFNVYPFQYGTTPYLGIEAGYGYGQIEGVSDYGFYTSGEVGVFAIKVSDFLLAASARFTLRQSSLAGKYPLGLSIRFGVLL
jgi:hypothetical protein